MHGGMRRQDGAEMAAVLGRCAYLLTIHDFAGCRTLALAAHRSGPSHPWPLQALAIAEVLLAAGNRLPRGNHDLYAILRVPADSAPGAIHARVTELLSLLNPASNKLPFSVTALRLVFGAWRVLSQPVARAMYDREVSAPPAKFHTACPRCYYMFVYEIAYEGHTLRCQNCWRPFRAVAIHAPLPEIVTAITPDGRMEEGYYCDLPPQFSSEAESPASCLSVEMSLKGKELGYASTTNRFDEYVKSEIPEADERPRKMRKTENRKEEAMESGAGNSVAVPEVQASDHATNIDSKIGDSNAGANALQFTYDEDEIFVDILDDHLTLL